MKVTLDLDRLLQEGQITPEEHARFSELASRDTTSLALNILVAFGVIAVAGGALALLQSAEASIALGAVVGIAGIVLDRMEVERWRPLAIILLLIGALMFGGGVVALTEGSVVGFGLLFVAFGVSAFLANSGLLVSLSALALLATTGGATGYSHAAYWLGIEQPLLTIVVFGALSWFATKLVLPPDPEQLATIFSRTCLFIVNFGFWIGSLWGDPLAFLARDEGYVSYRPTVIPEWAFSVTWAVGLVAVGVWGARENRRWVVNLAAVFGAIHFYTQYFETLDASPGSVLGAGVVALAIAAGLLRYNKASASRSPDTASSPARTEGRR
ncbi:MAG: hypothetical protein Rubg2KO_37370 [Rubricoccaceae bacterium]